MNSRQTGDLYVQTLGADGSVRSSWYAKTIMWLHAGTTPGGVRIVRQRAATADDAPSVITTVVEVLR